MNKINKRTINIEKNLLKLLKKYKCINLENDENTFDIIDIFCYSFNHAVDCKEIDPTKSQIWKIIPSDFDDDDSVRIYLYTKDAYLRTYESFSNSIYNLYHDTDFYYLEMKFENNVLSLYHISKPKH